MSLIKKTGVVSGIVFIVFIVIQFIQPARTKATCYWQLIF